jgi:hypothetical protein
MREFELREALDVAKKEVSQLQQHLQSAVNSKSFECVSCSNQAADLPSGATATSASPDEDDAMEGFTFPEYLRLKRENKALKHEVLLQGLLLTISNLYLTFFTTTAYITVRSTDSTRCDWALPIIF